VPAAIQESKGRLVVTFASPIQPGDGPDIARLCLDKVSEIVLKHR
jgi:hypothetical protein